MQSKDQIIRSLDELPDLTKEKWLFVDTETSGFSSHHGERICGVAIGTRSPVVNYYLPLRHDTDNLPLEEVVEWLHVLFCDPNKVWIGHNLKFDLKMFKAEGLEIKGRIIDTMVCKHVFNSSLYDYSLDALTGPLGFKHEHYGRVRDYIKRTQQIDIDSKAKGKFPNFSLVPVDLLGAYAMEDLTATRLLSEDLNNERMAVHPKPDNHGCAAWSTTDLIANEMDLIKVIAEMEYKGVQIDIPRCCELRDKTLGEMELLEQEMAALAGHSFNPNAWGDREKAFVAAGGEILFWNKKLEQRGKQKLAQFTEDKANSTGRANWNAQALLGYLKRHPRDSKPFKFIYAYKQYSLRAYVMANYVEAFLRMVDFDGVLHAQFHQHRVVTGRLSSSDPNLQNQAKKGGTAEQKDMERFLGIKDEEAINRKIRGLIVPRKGKVLVSVDWSQIEYRVAVFYSQDERMIGMWQADPKIDYHTQTQEDTGLERDPSKTINFMVLYGGGAAGLAASLSGMGKPTTKQEAQQFLGRLFEARPALKMLIADVSEQAMRTGYVQNCLGRVCLVPQGKSYVALNYLVQGTVGDMMREFLVRIKKIIKENNWPIDILLTVHDEVVFEMLPEDAEIYAPLLAAEMCKCEFISVPVLADIEVGETSWADAIPFEDWIEKRKQRLQAA